MTAVWRNVKCKASYMTIWLPILNNRLKIKIFLSALSCTANTKSKAELQVCLRRLKHLGFGRGKRDKLPIARCLSEFDHGHLNRTELIKPRQWDCEWLKCVNVCCKVRAKAKRRDYELTHFQVAYGRRATNGRLEAGVSRQDEWRLLWLRKGTPSSHLGQRSPSNHRLHKCPSWSQRW